LPTGAFGVESAFEDLFEREAVPMARAAPKEPAGLASMLIALRRFATGAAPSNDFERSLLPALQAAGRANPAIAQRMVDNFERITPEVRRRALGPFGDPAFVPQAGRAAAGPRPRRPRPRSATRAPRSLDFRPNAPAAPDVGGAFIHPPAAQLTYTIKYVGFHCDEEVDDQGDLGIFNTSEEVYAVTSAAHITAGGANVVRTEKHPIDRLEYDDVDAGETRLGPIAACWQGQGPDLPISFTVVAYERDFGDPDHYRDEIDHAVAAAIALAEFLSPGASATDLLDDASDFIVDGVNWLVDTDDDQVDIPRTLILSQQHLERMGRKGRFTYFHKVAMPFGDTITLTADLTCHFTTKHSGLGGRYVFGFDVERNPAFVEDSQGGID
jgi:hypothetical protein